jgi:pyridoxal phosphate enzyme (YggS family)
VTALGLAERYAAVTARVAAACERARRDPQHVTLIAVSKGHAVDAIEAVMACGQRVLGENYAQELADKQAELASVPVRWHFIGRLQSTKGKLVAGKVELVHAIDKVETAEAIGKRMRAGEVQPIALAINLGGEDTKGGVPEATAAVLARALVAVPGVRLDGLMTLPPPADDPEAMRPVFTRLRELRDRLADQLSHPLPVLSMGMSDDFEVAIACGATHVRIGTAIFGPRG